MDIKAFKEAMREIERHNRSMVADSLALIQFADDIARGSAASDAIINMAKILTAGESGDE